MVYRHTRTFVILFMGRFFLPTVTYQNGGQNSIAHTLQLHILAQGQRYFLGRFMIYFKTTHF